MPTRHSLAPRDYSPQELRRHALALAAAARLTRRQAEVLSSEIRNALAPVVFHLEMPDARAKEQASGSVRRILALMDAIDTIGTRSPRSRRGDA